MFDRRISRCVIGGVVAILLIGAFIFFYVISAYSLQAHRQDTPPVLGVHPQGSCQGHVQLCWLRACITHVFGVHLSTEDIYDMSPLYKYKTHIFINNPAIEYAKETDKTRKPPPRPGGVQAMQMEGERMLELIQQEGLLTGNIRIDLKLPQGYDIYGRNCTYTPHNDYFYTYTVLDYTSSVQVYVTENNLRPPLRPLPRTNYLFGTIRTRRTIRACQTLAHFSNDTYLFSCPILEDRFYVTIDAMYVSITTSDLVCRSYSVTPLEVFDTDFFTGPRFSTGILSRIEKTKCKTSEGHNRGFWLRIDKMSYWSTPRCYYPLYFHSNQVDCLRRMSVLMFGDRDMEKRLKALKKAYSLPNFTLSKQRHSLYLLSVLLDMYTAYLKGTKPPDVLVINVGQHDFRYLDIITYIATMSDILNIIEKFTKIIHPPQILWVETLPRVGNGVRSRQLTNQVVEATNDWVNHNMRQLGVEIIHSFDISFRVVSENGGNYDDAVGRRVEPGHRVSVGGAITSVIVHAICPLI